MDHRVLVEDRALIHFRAQDIPNLDLHNGGKFSSFHDRKATGPARLGTVNLSHQRTSAYSMNPLSEILNLLNPWALKILDSLQDNFSNLGMQSQWLCHLKSHSRIF